MIACQQGESVEAEGHEVKWIVVSYAPASMPSAPPFGPSGSESDEFWCLRDDGRIDYYGLSNHRRVTRVYSGRPAVAQHLFDQLVSSVKGSKAEIVPRGDYITETGFTVEHIPALAHLLYGTNSEIKTHYHGPASTLAQSSRELLEELRREFEASIEASQNDESSWLRATLSGAKSEVLDYESIDFQEHPNFASVIQDALSTPYFLIPVKEADALTDFLSEQGAYRDPIKWEGQILELRIVQRKKS